MHENGSAQRSIQIQTCHACGEAHDELSLKPYSKLQPPWTHFYLCPTTGDPVPMAIAMLGDSPIELNRKMMADVQQMTVSGRYYTLAFVVVDGRVTCLHHRNNFPIDDLKWCDEQWQGKLAETRAEAQGLAKPTEPLRRASISRTIEVAGGPLKAIVEQINDTPGGTLDPVASALRTDRPVAVAEAAHGDTAYFDDEDEETDAHDDSEEANG